MNINELNTISLNALNAATSTTGQALGLAVLDKQLEATDALNSEMIKAMENSVNPSVGRNIDVYV